MPQSFSAFLATLSSDARPAVAQALRRRAVRQLATLKASGAALLYAPTLDDRVGAIERAKDELAHLEQASEVFRELSQADLLGEAEKAAKELPVPGSWVEASVAQLVLCLAARVDLDLHRNVAPMLEPMAQKALADEVEHVSAARAALRELCAGSPESAQLASSCVGRWLDVALDSLDEDETKRVYLAQLEGEAQAIGLSLQGSPRK